MENGGELLRGNAYFMPTPPATNTTLLTSREYICGGGHTKLPPTRTISFLPRMSASGCHNHAAEGFLGEF